MGARTRRRGGITGAGLPGARAHARGDRAMTAVAIAAMRDALCCDRPGCACQRAGGNLHCPAHDDPNPSLSLDLKDGMIVWHCHAGCSQADVRDRLVERALWPPTTDT